MKKILLILLCLPMIGFGQLTMIPDPNFEQKLIDLGYDNVLDGSVSTSNINTVTELNVNNMNISDLTGIEDFTSLINLQCWYNQLTSLDVSQNNSLKKLICSYNQLTSLDVSGATSLDTLYCSYNQLTNLDVSQNNNLKVLTCFNNQLTSLDLSNNTALEFLYCYNNQLNSLDVSGATNLEYFGASNNLLECLDFSNNTALSEAYIQSNLIDQLNTKNGNWQNLNIEAENNNLTCVEVDNIGYASSNWASSFDSFVTFNTDCNYSNACNTTSTIQELTTNKELLKVTDLLGRETNNQNQPLIYYYNDGTVEKKIIIE